MQFEVKYVKILKPTLFVSGLYKCFKYLSVCQIALEVKLILDKMECRAKIRSDRIFAKEEA